MIEVVLLDQQDTNSGLELEPRYVIEIRVWAISTDGGNLPADIEQVPKKFENSYYEIQGNLFTVTHILRFTIDAGLENL
jgi:hypothetical protein